MADADYTEIQELIKGIREHYEKHFQAAWLVNLIEDLPVDNLVFRQVKDFVAQADIYTWSPHDLFNGLAALRSQIQLMKIYLSPHIKEKLRVSYLLPVHRIANRDLFLFKRLVAYTFPFNLARLEALTDHLSAYLTRAQIKPLKEQLA